jgi:16S rRNA (guanine527-N7)-methyltransferase
LNDDILRLLKDRVQDYGIALSDHHLNLFRIYLDELWEWNAHFNLTGLSSRERVVTELFLDSLIPAPFLPKEGKMLDVGSGAGFPGLPLKIYIPRLNTTLVESNSKKVSFLRHVIRMLRLKETEVVRGRVEKWGEDMPHPGYDLITARALAGLGQIFAWCVPLLIPGGRRVSFRGSGADEDLREHQNLMKKYRLSLHRKIPYSLPGKRTKRMTVIFKRKGGFLL